MSQATVWYQLGVDIGQVGDHTATVALRVTDCPGESQVDPLARPPMYAREGESYAQAKARVRAAYAVPNGAALPTAIAAIPWTRTMEVVECARFELGLPYPAQERRIAAAVRDPQFLSTDGERPRLGLDLTGVGRGPYDSLREMGVSPVGVSITAGIRPHIEAGTWRTPKRDLVYQTLTGFENKTLLIGATIPHADLLIEELKAFKATYTATGREQFGASEEWREGAHDDLVLALAIAVFLAGKRGWPQPRDFPKLRR